ncbi:MAG TPA: MBL fold metallo-hydrolase [Pirellulales bacterium]|nr:MBL fold metallo-hydrolase [Pirellulales bacterium]
MPRQSRLTLLALAVLLAGSSLLAAFAWRQVNKKPPPPEPAAERHQHQRTRLVKLPSQIGDGIYILGNMFPSAVYVVETNEGLVMFDSGLDDDHKKLVDALALLRLDVKRLKLIFLTHVHGDHTMGADRLRQETGAKVYIGREDAEPLRNGGPWEAIFSTFDMPGVNVHPGAVDGELIDGQTFALGEARITALATPGHTSGSFCYLIEHRNQRALCTGDTVMTLADGQGTYSTYLPPVYRGNAAEYLATLKRLRDMPKPDLVLPGHPTSDPVAQDPRVSVLQWQELLDRSIAEMERLTERYAADGADFLDGTPKQLASGLYYLGNAKRNAAYALVTERATLLFDAASADDPLEFLSGAWKTLGVDPPPVVAMLLTSCRAENLAGLEKLVDAIACRVIASPAGAEALVHKLPELSVSALDDLPPLDGVELQAVAMPGMDATGAAYSFQLGETKVLVTGEFPLESSEADLRELFSLPQRIDWDAADLEISLKKLDQFRPNLWLSAHPLHGRNANLYDDEWFVALSKNRGLMKQWQRLLKRMQ